MKLFQVTIPNDKHSSIVSVLQDDLEIDNVTSVEARTVSIVTFRVEDVEMQAILTQLQGMGVGISFGFCDVMSLTPGTTISTQKMKVRKKRLLQKSAEAGTALPVAEMYANIEASSSLSRDSYGMLMISSTLAGIGLAGDSPTYLVASMLLSPLMGPILGCAFGYAIRDRNLFMTGLKHELLALFLTLALGVVMGGVLTPYAGLLKWPTSEMRSRGQTIQLIFGAIVAALSGVAVALAESNKNISSVVGTAIAAALLPPTVNCGICLAYAVLGQYFIQAGDEIGDAERVVFYEIAVGSALLVWVNIIFIYLTAVLVFKLKRVGEFQLIRRVDADAWENLPRIQRTPKHKTEKMNRRFAPHSMRYPVGQEHMPLSPDDESDDIEENIPLSPTLLRNRKNGNSSSEDLDKGITSL